MENASKALIIAGAILISILLISVGIIIMNAINDPVQQGASSAGSQSIEMFNSKFSSYEGTQKGSELKGLKPAVIASNANDDEHQIAITTSNTSVTAITDLKPTKDYTVTIHYATGTSSDTYKGTVMEGAATVKTEKGYIYEIEIK